MRHLIALSLLLIASSPSFAAEISKPIDFKVSHCQNAGDSIQPQTETGKVLLFVNSPRGIGYCTVTARKGTWPEQVTVLLQGFKELEDFQLALGRMQIQGSRKTSGQFTLFFLGNDRNVQHRSQVGTIEVKVEQRPEGIVLMFPGLLFADADSVVFRWVDWFRS